MPQRAPRESVFAIAGQSAHAAEPTRAGATGWRLSPTPLETYPREPYPFESYS
jgi:hypothetical protein